MFKEIIFTDLQREEAAKLVAEYNKVRILGIVSYFRSFNGNGTRTQLIKTFELEDLK